MKQIKFEAYDMKVDITLKDLITILDDDTATGKTYIYNIIKMYSDMNKESKILCLNRAFKNMSEELLIQYIEQSKAEIVVIDNANSLINNKKVTDFICLDRERYYLLIGRSLYVNTKVSELAYPVINNNNISIEYLVNGV